MKTNIGDLVAQSMLNVLNSKEHARLFKKAYVEEDMNNAKAPACKACNDKGDCAMCGDGNMAHDDYLSMDSGDVSWMDDMLADEDQSFVSEASKKVRAAYSALEDLITASAALDYADLGKASELAVKLATLVSEAKKGKVDMKNGKKAPAKKMDSSKDSNDARAKKAPAKMDSSKDKNDAKKAPAKKDEKSTSSTSKSTSSSSSGKSSPAKKMTMKEKMEALRKAREKANKKKRI